MKIAYLLYAFIGLFHFLGGTEDKVYIFTYAFNRPDFIEIQHKTFKKFLKDEYDFIVFNDAKDAVMQKEIESTCERLGLTCINIPQSIHTLPYLKRAPGEDKQAASIRNCNVVQYSLDVLGFNHNGIVALFDSDLFLVKEISIKEMMKGYDVCALHQSRSKDGVTYPYFWIGLVFMDFSKMPNHRTINFNCGAINGCQTDSGGFTYYYLRDNPGLKVKGFEYSVWPYARCEVCSQDPDSICTHNHDQLLSMGFDEHQIRFIQTGPINSEMFEKKSFFHYRAGSNWNHRSPEYHMKKTKILNEYINAILSE